MTDLTEYVVEASVRWSFCCTIKRDKLNEISELPKSLLRLIYKFG